MLWNQTTYFGYFGEVISLSLGAGTYLIASGAVMLLFISVCLHHRAFFKIFEHTIDTLKQCDKKSLCDLIRFHVTVKE